MKLLKTKHLLPVLILLLCTVLSSSCGAEADNTGKSRIIRTAEKAAPFVPAADGSNYLNPIERNVEPEDLAAAAAAITPVPDVWPGLSVPTWITKIADTWFIVDCYHNQVLYSRNPAAPDIPLSDWTIMTANVTQAHTIAGDGRVYLVDDTENNKILVFERSGDVFVNTLDFWFIGDRPHYTVYDETTDTFYVWSSRTGELYLLRRADGTGDVYQTEIRSVEGLNGIYIRSFTILGDLIYFVSGVTTGDNPDYTPAIYCCDLETLEIIDRFPVADRYAGMTQLFPTGFGDWLVSVSTDAAGNQDAATLLRVKDLADLADGRAEDIYSTYFAGGGTPYYISRVGDDCFLTEHRLEDHAIWRFRFDKKGKITDVEPLY